MKKFGPVAAVDRLSFEVDEGEVLGLTVIISARVKGVREAQQISALLLVPLFAAVLAQASGSMFFDPLLITGLTTLLIAFDIIILVASVKAFGRDHILARLS